MTIVPPYTWTFTPGVTSVQGSFWADGTRLTTVTGPPPYNFNISDGLLSNGPHTLGHSWDLADGGHFSPPRAYSVTVQNSSDGGSADGGYEAAIAYTQSRPAFTATRTVVVTSQSQLTAALSNLQAGDLVDCQGAFTVSGELTISKQLSAYAVVDFKTGANAVKFVGPANQNLPAVYIPNASYIRFYGGDLSTQSTGGGGILIHGGDHLLWWGFYIHDCGGTGLSMFTDAAITNCDIQGEITNVGLNVAWDPHQEKGTGIHGANLADGSAYAFSNNRVALYVHDQPSGAAIELGEPVSVPDFTGNTLYLKAVNLTKVATSQTAGNALQLWGVSGLGLDVDYLEAENCQGRAVDGEGFNGANNGSGVTVHQGVAANVCLNASLNESGISSTEPWDTRWGITYQNVQPPP